MKILTFSFKIIFIFIVATGTVFSQTYQVPPSKKTYGNVPYISDAAMVECVSLYNKAEWLSKDLKNTNVDQYNQVSVNTYNQNIAKHANMTAIFNKDCAGKQSYSAHKAAQALNIASKGVKK